MSKESNEHFEFTPRSIKHKKKKKKRSSFIILAILLLLSLGGVSATVLNLGLVPQLQMGAVDQEQDQETTHLSDTDQNQTDTPSDEINNESHDTLEEKPEQDQEIKTGGAKEEGKETVQSESGQPSPNDSDSKGSSLPQKETSKAPAERKPEFVITHEVGSNETLFSITKKYYLNSNQQHRVAQFNGITNPETDIKVGLKLKLPDPDIIALHEVVKGETLFSITNKYYGNANHLISLANYNRIVDPAADVKIGKKLYIPHPTLIKNYAQDGYTIAVNKTMNTLTVYREANIIQTFSIATGKDPSLTPEGIYQIVNKVEKPWYNPKNIPGGDPNNPLGSHWLGLNVPDTNNFIYGIHGTNDPSSIGKHVSLGCIRMDNTDVLWMYNNIPLQTTVYIFSE
ncbi:L,D-transpeptidase family protein [Alkalihalobacillus sp. BA299]|uniref:L,D-transpeptidase family protein n=1 Tax=Alkalihalobacillus sp. BA299 TaxID=2815938 RepID=UPI001ADC97FD|nr:L,D-transpeptidase family protein [Alkalihalobacillus sp. BA299]